MACGCLGDTPTYKSLFIGTDPDMSAEIEFDNS